MSTEDGMTRHDVDRADSIVVTGTGRAGAAPDALVIDLRLDGHGRTVTDALDAVTRASEAAIRALPDQRLRTHGLGLHARTTRSGEPAGHTAYQSLRVRSADPAAAGHLIAHLAAQVGDALSVEQLRPEVTDIAPLHERAREAAVSDARARAEHYAALVDRALGPALRMRETTPDRPGPVTRMAMVSAAGPPVDADDHEVVATVEVTWRLRG